MYFGGVSETKDVLKRPLKIWKQVIFYSVTSGVIAIITGMYRHRRHKKAENDIGRGKPVMLCYRRKKIRKIS